MPTVWQIAAGEPCRDYSELFLDHDVMFMGPGHLGAFYEEHYRHAVEYGIITSSNLAQLRGFCERMEPGDIVLLRTGYRVRAVGLIPDSGYVWEETFDDVFGWDLQHTRRVLWQDHLDEELSRIQRAEGDLFKDRKQIPTLTRVQDPRILGPIEHLLERCETRLLKPMPPKPPPPLDMDELGAELFGRGLPNEWVDKTIIALQRQRRLVLWYETHGAEGGRPHEHEVVAHMILPLLLALGWSEQLLAVEWHRVDLAAFTQTPTTEETCVLVCEAKGLGHGLQPALIQARRYVRDLSLRTCRKILLTDGKRLYIFEGEDAEWSEQPVGYLNVERIRTNHLAPANTNAVDTIVTLTPMGVERPCTSRDGGRSSFISKHRW